MGTMHLATKEAYTYADIAKKYMLKAAVYAGEMNLGESVDEDLTSFFLSPGGKLFQENFRPKVYKKYQTLVRKCYDISLDDYKRYTPFYINNLLAEAALPAVYHQPLDQYLWEFAVHNNRITTGVESLRDQIDILQNIPMDYQIKAFRDNMKNIKAFRHKLLSINAMYADGQYRQLYKSTQKSMGKIRNLMIYDRNKKMANAIIRMSDEKSSFFAIGAAHFAGNKGILAFLKKEGYKIKQITH